MPKTVTIKLDKPLTCHAGERFTQVVVREPTPAIGFREGRRPRQRALAK
jgi:hypothetical protein